MDDIRTEVVSDKYTDEENSDAFSEYQGAILWPRRSLLYRICFLALLPLFAVFLLGFSSPFWMKKHQVDKYLGYYNLVEKVDVSIGLWRVCEGTDFSDITDCTGIPDTTSYMMACQAMLCLSFIFTVFSLIFGLYENCATRYDIDDGTEAKTKRPEMNAITAGIFGLIGVGMYGVIIIHVARNGEGAVHWAFPVTAASVTGVIVCGILMAIANPIHASTQSYPGQIMSLSRQNSARIREPNIQDRLVVTNEAVVQVASAQASGTMYGVTGNGYESREAPFLQRSESCLSSHMSSPDIYTAASQEPGLPHVHRSTHVVETHDIHSRGYDTAKRQAFKQQLQNKAAQRRSWHFDDRNGAYVVTELINSRPCAPLPPDAKGQRDTEGVKPPVPPRRDKIISPPNPNRPSMNQTLTVIPDETADLMILDDPVVIAPSKAEQNQNAIIKTDDRPVVKRNTNPFLDDSSVPEISSATQNFTELQRSTVSSGSWESQPWPDPPPECEIIAQKAPAVPKNSSSTSEGSTSNTPVPQLNSVPESLQYQPQNYASLSRKQGQEGESKSSYPNPEHNSTASNGSHGKSTRSNGTDRSHRPNRKSASGKTPPPNEGHVPIMKEYDNPLFKKQTTDDSRPAAFEEDFSLQICESTSFVNPSPERPPPPEYYAVVNTMQSEPTSYRRHSGHQLYSPIAEDPGTIQQAVRHISHEGARDAPPAYNRQGKPTKAEVSKKHSTSKEKSRSSNKQHQHQNGGVKSRLPRQVKREHQQRRSGHPDAGTPQQQQQQQTPPSPHGGRYGSSPNLASKSPNLGRRRPDSTGARESVEYAQADHYRNVGGRSKTPPQYSSNTYGYDRNRQSPYYNSPANQYRHWGDSDL